MLLLLLPIITFPSYELKGRVNIKSTIYSRQPEIYVKYLADIKRIMLLNSFYDFRYIPKFNTVLVCLLLIANSIIFYEDENFYRYLVSTNEPCLARPNNWACILTCLYISIITYNKKLWAEKAFYYFWVIRCKHYMYKFYYWIVSIKSFVEQGCSYHIVDNID